MNAAISEALREVYFEYSRSPGPGGQHVNKVATQATLCLDLGSSRSLTAQQKNRIRQKLAGRISKKGILRVTSRRHRSQKANRGAAVDRFKELLGDALAQQKRRIKTRISASRVKARLEQKRRRSQVKQLRRRPVDRDS